MAGNTVLIPEIKDKRQRRWEAQTFMGMVAAMIQGRQWASKGLRAAPALRIAGFPLDIPKVGAHCSRRPEIRASKKTKRAKRQALIRRRGWA